MKTRSGGKIKTTTTEKSTTRTKREESPKSDQEEQKRAEDEEEDERQRHHAATVSRFTAAAGASARVYASPMDVVSDLQRGLITDLPQGFQPQSVDWRKVLYDPGACSLENRRRIWLLLLDKYPLVRAIREFGLMDGRREEMDEAAAWAKEWWPYFLGDAPSPSPPPMESSASSSSSSPQSPPRSPRSPFPRDEEFFTNVVLPTLRVSLDDMMPFMGEAFAAWVVWRHPGRYPATCAQAVQRDYVELLGALLDCDNVVTPAMWCDNVRRTTTKVPVLLKERGLWDAVQADRMAGVRIHPDYTRLFMAPPPPPPPAPRPDIDRAPKPVTISTPVVAAQPATISTVKYRPDVAATTVKYTPDVAATTATYRYGACGETTPRHWYYHSKPPHVLSNDDAPTRWSKVGFGDDARQW